MPAINGSHLRHGAFVGFNGPARGFVDCADDIDVVEVGDLVAVLRFDTSFRVCG